MGSRTDNLDRIGWVTGRSHARAFSLLEVLTALAILGLTSSSVLVVIDRCIISAADSALRMEAFQLARENLENILVLDSVSETTEYGISELYPDISWQTTIEAFSEPATGQMWVRAVCSAEYMDSGGQTQTVKLEHWLTEISDQQAGQLASQEDLDQLAAEQLLQTVDDAADYAAVESKVIEDWVGKGLVKTTDGAFIKYNLEVFMQSDGTPSAEEKRRQVKSIQELALALRTEQEELTGGEGAEGQGPTKQEQKNLNMDEVMNLLKQKQRPQR